MTARARLLRSVLVAPLLLLLAACGDPAVGSPPTPVGTPGGTAVAVIGDSIASGYGLTVPQAWPALLAQDEGWDVDDLGVAGAGFVASGSNGTTYAHQVDQAIQAAPRLVVITATDNDMGTDDATLRSAVSSAVLRLKSALPGAELVGLSALSGSAGDADLAEVDSVLQSAVTAAGGRWITLGQPYAGRTGLVQSDGEHPTADGQKVIEAALRKALAGIPVPDAASAATPGAAPGP